MIPVTKPFLVPIEEYQHYLTGIWERQWLTNHGPLVLELEEKLRQRLSAEHFFFVSNGTIALQIAIKALDLTGEIITTPFSYVATTSSISWENCKPVFVDIEEDSLTLNADLIEAAITPATTGILATHVYGIPCNVEAIEAIARKHNLKVIYDGAHAFGVNFKGRPLLDYGHISTLSFHATKLYHTVEGGAIITPDKDLAHRIAYLRNFGHNGPEAFFGVGINGKNSEFHAAMGLCNLKYVEGIIASRKQVSEWYDAYLLPAKASYRKPTIRPGTDYNYAYFPIILPSEEVLLQAKQALEAVQVFTRRYFFPSLNTLAYTGNQPMPVAEDIAKRVLCLPLYYGLQESEVQFIAQHLCKVLAR